MNNKIREIRKNKKIRLNELAKNVNITRHYLRKIELGLQDPTIRIAMNISKALETSITDLFFEHDVNHC